MSVIYKFPIHELRYPIQVPKGSVFRHIDTQHGIPTLWIEMDPGAEPREVIIRGVATGQPTPKGGSYLGTALVDEFVWHLFSEEPL